MLHDVLVIAIKAVAAGTLVVCFSLLGHILRPKWFAGLFSAAPSVALASLVVTVLDKGPAHAAIGSEGMTFGALGFVVFALCVHPMLQRYHAVVASSVAVFAWLIVAGGAYLAVFG